MPEPWAVVILNETVQGELDERPDNIRADFLRIVELMTSYGLENMREPCAKRFDGKLWEIRKGRNCTPYESPQKGAA